MREAILKITMPDNWVKDVCKKYPNPIKVPTHVLEDF